jgi:DNA-binding MarR family transcriptional regulator
VTSPPANPELADRLHRLLVLLLRRLAREDEALGLSGARLSALSVLEFAGPLTLGQLAAAERVRPPTMSRLVAALEREGWVERAPGPGDRRQVLLRTTPAGSRLMQQGRRRRASALSRRLARLSPDELALLERATELLERVGDD